MPIARKIVNYYHVVIVPSKRFRKIAVPGETGKYRKHDVGRKGHSYRLAGVLNRSRRWATHSFHFHTSDVKVIKGRLVGKIAPVSRAIRSIERRQGKIKV